MHTIFLHSHLPGEVCGLIKSFPFCSWLATFGPCCSFPHRNWLSGSCQGSIGKSRASKLPCLMEHHSPTMALGGRPPSAGMMNFPVATRVLAWEKRSDCSQSIPVSFYPLLHPSALPEASMLGTAEPLWASMLSEEEEEAEG